MFAYQLMIKNGRPLLEMYDNCSDCFHKWRTVKNSYQYTQLIYRHYTGEPVMADTHTYELEDFVAAKFYCLQALADGIQCIWIRFIRHREHCRFTDLCREADDNLFNSILNNSHHVLHHLLPSPSQVSQHYSLRSRRHNLQLSITPTSLIDKNFIPHMLQMDSY